jgi:hypothetical protein
MGARWYDPALGRWSQPDTIIPEKQQGVQSWDRFAYTNNNSLRFVDPTGHWLCGDDYDPACAEDIWELGEYQQGTYASKPLILDKGNGVVIVVMAPGNQQKADRSEFQQKLGLAGELASIVYDVGEIIFAIPPDPGIGEEDLAAAYDIVVTAAASYLGGLSWTWLDQPVEELPRMITFNQDIAVPIIDFLGALGVKGMTWVVAGPAGSETIGSLTDVGLSAANGVYDFSRTYGFLDSNFSAGWLSFSGNPLKPYLIYYP